MPLKDKIYLSCIGAKALAFSNSISSMPEGSKRSQAPSRYGEDYNKVVDELSVLFPDLKKLLPPNSTSTNDGYSSLQYIEIQTYCEQIYQMISAIERSIDN